jgi:hypothetical protein
LLKFYCAVVFGPGYPQLLDLATSQLHHLATQTEPAGPTFHSPFDYYPELLNLVSWLRCHLCRRYSLHSSTSDTGATELLPFVLVSFG